MIHNKYTSFTVHIIVNIIILLLLGKNLIINRRSQISFYDCSRNELIRICDKSIPLDDGREFLHNKIATLHIFFFFFRFDVLIN
jgi:hypothetical protein